MNQRSFLPLIMSIFCAINAPAQNEGTFDTAAEQYLHVKLNETLSDDAFFQKLSDSWQEDIRISRAPGQNPSIENLSDSEMEAVHRTVENYLTAARASYEAQMEFAEHSLTIVQQKAPELYATTLNRYRSALQHLYVQELQILRTASPLAAVAPAAAYVGTDDFIDAICHRANISAGGGADYREFCSSADTIAQQQLELKRKYIIELISHAREDIYLVPELLSNYSPDCERPATNDSTAADKFTAAEAAWETYSRSAADLLHPGGWGEGQSSEIFKMHLRLKLMKSHEKYYTLLLMGFTR